MASPTQERPALHLVAGRGSCVHERAGWDAPPPLARPADRCEPWPLDEPAARSLARAAAELGIAFELAAVITVERSLLEDDIRTLHLDDPAATLEAKARAAVVTGELSEPLSAYLGSLDRSARGRAYPSNVLVLPMRLSERIGSCGPAFHLEASLLPSAIAWERASVLAGRTMTEWALLTLARGAS